MTRQTKHICTALSVITTTLPCLLPQSIFAASISDKAVEEIQVVGSIITLNGKPQSATEGFVSGDQLALRPASRPAELLEFVPGLIATQHSGEGKGNQYFLRGFNLDHGTDLALKIDGLPVNMPSHAHGQGYADINFLIPELVESLTYRKGPYYAEIGDFGTAGSSEFHYIDSLYRPRITLTTGQSDYRRLFAGGSTDVADGQLTFAGAHTDYDGPWSLPQDLDKTNALIKFHKGDDRRDWSLTGMAYDNAWNSTDQIPLRAVTQGTLDNYDAIDNSDGGNTHRYSLSLESTIATKAGNFSFDAYAIDYDLALFSNFTYFLEDPIRGDQFEQSEQRNIAGFNAAYERETEILSIPTILSAGIQSRFDRTSLGLYKTQNRIRHTTTREDDVKQSLNSLYSSLEQQWTERIRTVVAMRLDRLDYEINSNLLENSGKGHDTLFSPKANLAYTLSPNTELFLSTGLGFHSNDTRGATTTVDPVSLAPVSKVDPLSQARSAEIGIRTTAIPKAHIAVSTFSLSLDSELLYIGDAGTTEALGGTRRSGLELGVVYTPFDWLMLDTDLTSTHGRFNNGTNGRNIPNSVARTAALGVTAKPSQDWNVGLRIRYLGAAPLTEDNAIRSEPTLMFNAQASYRVNPNVLLSLAAFNLTDERDNDITYYYESRLSNESTSHEDIHFHPVEPRSLRLTIEIQL
jgi:hypothetical protein